jgi:hypothetical protein
VVRQLSDEHMFAELSCKPKYLLICASNEEYIYDIVQSELKSLESSVKAVTQATDGCKDISGSPSVRNPLKVKSKGMPKGSRKMYRSMPKQKRQGESSCGTCKQCGLTAQIKIFSVNSIVTFHRVQVLNFLCKGSARKARGRVMAPPLIHY